VRDFHAVWTPSGRHLALCGNSEPTTARVLSRDLAYATPAAGRTRVTNARGHASNHTLDSRGRMTERVDALGARTTLVWDDATTNDNNVLELREAAGDAAHEALTKLTYNPNGLPLTSTDYPQGAGQAGRTTTLSYIYSGGAPGQSESARERQPGCVDRRRRSVRLRPRHDHLAGRRHDRFLLQRGRGRRLRSRPSRQRHPAHGRHRGVRRHPL
jgi:YD repeat-containing protein